MSKTDKLMKERRKLSERQVNWIVWGMFVCALLLVSLFHEITYDEAQAWLIARDASISEILFRIPHYEGHPPLWHLMLAVMAKSNVSPQLGLHVFPIILSSISMWFLIFKSPFRRSIRYSLPFTYYLFYRYSVVARPYCITLLAFVLAAYLYKRKEEHPVRFCLALLLLSSSNAFGMVFAAGICIAWLIELLTNKVKRKKIKWIKTGLSLSVLLIVNCLQLILMIPNPDTNSVGNYSLRSFLYSLIYMLIVAPADSMFLDSGMDARLQDYAERILFMERFSAIWWICGLVTVLVIVFFFAKRKKVMLFLIPYGMYAVFAAKVYFWYHHIGLGFLFLIFASWCALEEYQRDEKETNDWISNKLLNKTPLLILAFVLGVGISMAWNIYDCWIDIRYPIWYTKQVAEGIREVGADQNNCALQWDYYPIVEITKPEQRNDPKNYGYNVSITCFFDCLVYFDKNIFYNHNDGDETIAYNRQILYNSEREELWRYLSQKGSPEFIVGNYIVLGAVPGLPENPSYYPVYRFEVRKPDKFMVDYNDQFIYAREDIYTSRENWPIKKQLNIP